ncbi:hypothetical protein DOY81_007787, partial [Sarcophaga bullata]
MLLNIDQLKFSDNYPFSTDVQNAYLLLLFVVKPRVFQILI